MTLSNKAVLGLLAAWVITGCAPQATVKPDRPTETQEVGTAPKPGEAPKPAVAKDPGVQFDEALAALKAKKLPEARAGFAALAKEHPEFSGPLTNLGVLDAKANARDAAINNFNRAVEANPRNAIAYNWLGILYRESKNYPRAEQSYLKSLEINPESAPVVLNLAILYDVYLKRPADALTRYRDYQRMTNNRELKVTAWIKALEATELPASPVSPPTAVPKT